MSMSKISASTVALIAHGIMERKVKFGHLDATNFTSMKPYGTGYRTFREQAQHEACIEAWDLVKAAEETRPKE